MWQKIKNKFQFTDKIMTYMECSYLAFVQNHVGDSINNGIFSLAVHTYELAFNDMGLNYGKNLHQGWFCEVFWDSIRFIDTPERYLLGSWLILVRWLSCVKPANLVSWSVEPCCLCWIRSPCKWISQLRSVTGNCSCRI